MASEIRVSDDPGQYIRTLLRMFFVYNGVSRGKAKAGILAPK